MEVNLHGFADARQFRVRLPSGPHWPYAGGESLEVCRENDPSQATSEWLSINELAAYFPAKFTEKNPLSIPGPIYGAETDTCGTGPLEAPGNVLLDAAGQEFVFRQAATADEFRDLVSAAICDSFRGYGADGDAHWRLSTIRDWWRTREDMVREPFDERWCRPESVQQWKRALQGEAEGYLRVYAFFVENNRVPRDGDVLPDVE